MYFVAVVAHICTKQCKQHIYVYIYVYIYKMIKKKVQRITVLRIFAFYSNYGSSVIICQIQNPGFE